MTNQENIDGQKVKVRGYIFTWSNLLSFTRVLIAFPVIYLHVQNNYDYNLAIILLILYAILSDYLDGMIARLRDEISELGKLLDPVADKLLALALYTYTVWLGWIPLWFFIVAVIRDLLIVAGSIYIKKIHGKVAMSIMSGKISVNVLALYWISVFFFRDLTGVHYFLMVMSLLLMIVSLADYYKRFHKIVKGAEFN